MDFNQDSFIEYINSLELQQLRNCQTLINEVLLNKVSLNDSNNSLSISHDNSIVKNIDDFVGYKPDYIDINEKTSLQKELNLLDFNKNTTSDAIQNRFISIHDEPYTWGSSKGRVVNKATSFDEYPVIKTLMEKVNSDFGYNMNCALVSYYRCGTVNVRKHDDNEASISQNEPICVVSLGSNRRVEFYNKVNDSFKSAAAKSITPKESSLYVMKQGCQEHFKHRVPLDRRVKHSRICISFRCFIPESKREITTTTATPQKMSVSTPLSSLHVMTLGHPTTTTSCDTSTVSQDVSKKLSDQFSPHLSRNLGSPPPLDQEGYAPYDKQSSFTRTSFTGISTKQKSDEKLCLLFGTSITTGIDAAKMSRGSRTVVNCSYSGAQIHDIQKVAQDFYVENPQSIDIVDRIIISVGTNEVKFFNSERYDIYKRYRAPLIELVKNLKFMYPHAIITFQSVLPIRLYYRYTAKSIYRFNDLLFEICRNYGCMFLDCFEDFLDQYHYDINRDLYRDNLHLNDIGLSRLCRALKFLIYRSNFNPLVRYHHTPHYHHFK